MDARETLERRIDELCRENEQLRQEIKTLERECEAVENMYQSVRSVLRNVVRTICVTCPDKDMCEHCYLRPCVEDALCGHAFNSLVVDKLARNLYMKWSSLVAEVAIYDKLQHGTPTVELHGPYL